MAISAEASHRHQLFACWCAPIFTVLTIIGWFGFAQGLMPVPADLGAAATKDWFVAHQQATAIGCSIFLIATGFLSIFIAQLSVMLAEAERGAPVMAIAQAGGGYGVVVLVILSCCLWIGAGYRAEASPDIAVLYNDASWFGFLLGYIALTVQMLVTAAVGLADKDSWMPRWWSWASVVGGLLLVTANGPAFTQSGPFAFHGLAAYYLPMVIWAIWLDGTALLMRRELRRRKAAP